MGREIDVLHAYLRIANKLSADGLALWTEEETLQWMRQERMQQVAVPLEWLKDWVAQNELPYGRVMGTFESSDPLSGFPKWTCSHAFEWRPGR